MFPVWRFKLSEARQAMKLGRWDDAAALLASPGLREYLPAKQLAAEVATQLLRRAERRQQLGQTAAGWRDLDQASLLQGAADEVDAARARRGEELLAEVAAAVAQGDLGAAADRLDKLDERRLAPRRAPAWRRALLELDRAERSAAAGDFRSALAALELVQAALPAGTPVAVVNRCDQREQLWKELGPRASFLEQAILTALNGGDWASALSAADALLELAPRHSAARDARRRAWRRAGVAETHHYSPQAAGPRVSPADCAMRSRPADSTRCRRSQPQSDTVNDAPRRGRRLLAWIDEVGGYMICLGDEVMLGQPTASPEADVPILGDLSRRHARLRREGEAYVLTPLQAVQVDGRPITESVVLRDRAILRLGEGVEIRFRKPHALSGSAVLEFVSHHRTAPAVDGIVLMSESCVFGPQGHCHVPCPRWSQELVLFRRGEQLLARSRQPLTVDGVAADQPATLNPPARLEGEEFAVSFEEI